MVVEALEENVIAQIRSSSAIDSISQCVTELVLNSLDAKSTAIAIRVNLTTFRIQVVDNGKGITRANLEFVGQRYMTNKCHSLTDLKKHLKYYGFKGEALANISQISQRITIVTKEQNAEETFIKIIEKSQINIDSTKPRASFGTTVTVEGFFSNLPVRQQCVKNNELDNIKRSLESLIIIHPRVSFTLRNDLGAKLILASVECPDIATSFKTIHTEIDETKFTLLKVSKNKTIVEGLIHKQFHENKRLQYLYVNKRPINAPKIQNFVNLLFKNCPKSDPKKKNPIYVIHIKVPYADVDIILEPAKTFALFRKIDILKRCLQKMVQKHLGGDYGTMVTQKTRWKYAVSDFGVSQIGGAVKGIGTKRKSDDFEEEVSNKSAKIVEDTPYFEEPKVISKQTKAALPVEIKKCDKQETTVMDNSLFTNFPENEKKGKDVIMDMFIMSLKAFSPENKEPESVQNVTVTEEPMEVPSLFEENKLTKAIQTSLNKTSPIKTMVSVGIQAGSSSIQVFDNDVTFMPRKSLSKYVSEYDFDFSKVLPVFNFRRNDTEIPFNSNQTRKLFDFRDSHTNRLNFFDNNKPVYSLKKFLSTEDTNALENTMPDSLVENRRNVFSQRLQSDDVKKSPYFSKQSKKRNILSLKKTENVNETCLVNRPSRHCICNRKNLLSTNISDAEVTFIQKEKTYISALNETTTSKYFTTGSYKPIFQCPGFGQSRDLFSIDKSSELDITESNLYITIDEEDKTRISEKQEKERSTEDIIPPTLTQSHNCWIDSTEKKPLPHPKKDISFEITERLNFVPKGLSPILKDFAKVDNMSPASKEQLQNALVQSYENELLLIKWQNYIDNKDPQKFFEEIYLEKSKHIIAEIPTAYKHGKDFENMSFTTDLFKNINVIGQVDCKFIAVWEETRNLLLLFDQHAVHERVRLEDLCEGYKNASTKLDQNITFFLQNSDINLLKRQKSNIAALGLILDFFTNGLTIYQVPLCIYNKSKKGVDIVSLTESLIKEIIEILRLNGVIVNTPTIIQNIVNSEACRGAIKFGDPLTRNECFMHLKNLAKCKLPFQCAHGRPTLTPLLYLNKFYDIVVSKPRLCTLE